GKNTPSNRKCFPTFGPPFRTRMLVATNSPPPSNNPAAMPQARPLRRRMAAFRDSSFSVMFWLASARSDVIQEVVALVQVRLGPDHEDRNREHHVAAERHEPTGHKTHHKAPHESDERTGPGHPVEFEVLPQQPEVSALHRTMDEIHRGESKEKQTTG